MEEKKKVPKLRFPGFTDDWEQHKLSDIVKEVTRTNENSSAPVMMITANDGFINQSERYSTDNAGQSLKKYILLEKGELAYNHGASKLRPYGSCFALTTEQEARIPFVYHCFSTETENPEFLSLVLNGKAVERQLRKIVSSGARMDGLLNISFEEYTSIPIIVPKRDEQDRIADYFRTLGEAITLHQREYDLLKEFKKGCLQKMFPRNGEAKPELRFPGFTDDWEQRKLSDLVDVCSGMDYKHLSIGNIPVFGTGGYMLSVDKALSYDRDAIGIGRKGTIDKPYILKAPFWTVDTLFYCIPRDEGTLNFDYDLFQCIDWKQKDESTGVPSLSKVAINDTDVMVPKTDEQKKIGYFFEELDLVITLHQRKLDELNQFKKGMLQKMFV